MSIITPQQCRDPRAVIANNYVTRAPNASGITFTYDKKGITADTLFKMACGLATLTATVVFAKAHGRLFRDIDPRFLRFRGVHAKDNGEIDRVLKRLKRGRCEAAVRKTLAKNERHHAKPFCRTAIKALESKRLTNWEKYSGYAIGGGITATVFGALTYIGYRLHKGGGKGGGDNGGNRYYKIDINNHYGPRHVDDAIVVEAATPLLEMTAASMMVLAASQGTVDARRLSPEGQANPAAYALAAGLVGVMAATADGILEGVTSIPYARETAAAILGAAAVLCAGAQMIVAKAALLGTSASGRLKPPSRRKRIPLS